MHDKLHPLRNNDTVKPVLSCKNWVSISIIAKCRSKALQNALEHSAIISTFIKLLFSNKTFILSIFKWLLKKVFLYLYGMFGDIYVF